MTFELSPLAMCLWFIILTVPAYIFFSRAISKVAGGQAQSAHSASKPDAVLSDISIEGFSNYSAADQIEIVAALGQSVRFGRHDLGPMKFDINTGRKFNTVIE